MQGLFVPDENLMNYKKQGSSTELNPLVLNHRATILKPLNVKPLDC